MLNLPFWVYLWSWLILYILKYFFLFSITSGVLSWWNLLMLGNSLLVLSDTKNLVWRGCKWSVLWEKGYWDFTSLVSCLSYGSFLDGDLLLTVSLIENYVLVIDKTLFCLFWNYFCLGIGSQINKFGQKLANWASIC